MNNTIERQREHFNSIAGRYSQARRHENHLTLKAEFWADFLGRHEFPASIRVLEPMCGYADGNQILSTHLSSSIDYSGFDYSEAVVDEVRQSNPDANVWFQDVTQFDDSEQYDVIILLGGLHHVPQHARSVVAALYQNMKPGGYFINLEPTHGNRLFRAVREFIYRRNSLFDEQTEQAFDSRDLDDMFTEPGFQKIDASSPGLLSYILYYNPDAFPFLNRGKPDAVKRLYSLEKRFLRSFVARKLSFATLSLWQRPG